MDTLAAELEKDRAQALALWSRRLTAPVEARHRPGFSAALTRAIGDGQCCDYGRETCTKLDDLGEPA